MKNKILLFILFVASFNINAQQAPIMVCNTLGTSCAPYYNLDAAIDSALPGDYVYIPGGVFSFSGKINKEIHLVGAGHYPDSTNVTGQSSITATFTLDTGCSNSSFEGLYISHISVPSSSGSGGGTVNNVSIIRCNIPNLSLNSNMQYIYSYTVLCHNCLIKDCVIGGFNPYCTNCTIGNCILTNGITNVNSSTVKNCIIFNSFYYDNNNGIYSSNNTVKNNIFDSSYYGGTYECQGCVLTNNLTINNSLGLVGGSFLEIGTITNIPLSNLFVNANTAGFDYTKDFHLLSSSPGHNAGDDGTDVGIYGSSTPYKNGAVPSNPHVMFKSVSGGTDASGNLPVQIKVRIGN